jgi:uncharacterized iron-regulated membrane protein
MNRHFWVLIHRYVGLTMALFLIVAGLTGSILAFYDELDDWLNPESSRGHTRISVHSKPLFDAFELCGHALMLVPHARITTIELEVKPDEAYTVYLEPSIDPATRQPYPLDFDTLKLNPYTGTEVARSKTSGGAGGEFEFPLTRKNILAFIYALHFNLALGETGILVFGIVALIWTFDCFVGFYLTLPPRGKQSFSLIENAVKALSRVPAGHKGEGLGDDCMDAGGRATQGAFAEGKLKGSYFSEPPHPSLSVASSISANALPPSLAVVPKGRRGRTFWQRWKPAWLIKRSASALRVNFDLHRAFGLWTWIMLFIFAWSSVMFNLPQVYNPVMGVLFKTPPEQSPQPVLPETRPVSPADFRKAHAIGKRLMAEQAKLHRFTVKREAWVQYDGETGLFSYIVNSDRDVSGQWVQTSVSFDASTGKLAQLGSLPTGEYSGLTVQYWLWTLHMARIWGLPYKLFVCFMGLVITMLSITGIYIWLKKHRAARFKRKVVV